MEKELIYGLRVIKEDTFMFNNAYTIIFKNKDIRDIVFENTLHHAEKKNVEYLENSSESISYWEGDIKTIIEKTEQCLRDDKSMVIE